MSHPHRFAIFFVAIGTVFTSVHAQNIYRCGDSYSQSPCPGGVAIDAGDSRTKGQKAQADAATQRDRQTANTLEKERLKQEAAVAPATHKAEAAKASTAAAAPHPSSKKKPKEPAYFTAKTTADKKAEKKKSAAAP